MYRFVDLDGNPINKTPYSNPYRYDSFVVWQDKDFDKGKCNSVDSDRLYQWDSEKYNKCRKEVFNDKGQYFYQADSNKIEKFLSLYFEKEIKLTAVVQNCNVSSGFPYWTFFFEDIDVKKKELLR